jgi:hypothetical protein
MTIPDRAPRLLISVGAVVVTIAVAVLTTMSGAGQAPATGSRTRPAEGYTPPRTPDGQPDLQGFWTNATYTPLERPDNVTKAFYTPEEASDVEKRAAAREREQTTPGTVADVHYDFTQFALDRSQSTLAHTLRTSLIVDPPNGKLPPLSAVGQRRAAASAADAKRRGGRWDSAENNQLDDRCIIMSGAGPPMLDAGYNSNYQIVQAPGYVMILVEMIHDFRVIPLDGRPEPPSNVRHWMGIPRGRWDGSTLVVETTNFNGKNPFRGSSENLRVTERFTRVSEDTIRYTFTLDDDATWSRPWTGELNMEKTGGPIFEHACHEGNYGLYNTLVGARLEEKKAMEGVKKGSTLR